MEIDQIINVTSIPRWMLEDEDYPGKLDDVSVWIQSAAFWKLPHVQAAVEKGKLAEVMNDPDVARVLIDSALIESFGKASVIEEMSQRVILTIVNEINLRQLQFTGGLNEEGYDTLTEFLESKRAQKSLEDKPGEAGNIEFIIEHVIPLLKGRGTPFAEVLAIRENWAKVRESVPLWKKSLNMVKSMDQDYSHRIGSLDKKIATAERNGDAKKKAELSAQVSDLRNSKNRDLEAVKEKAANDIVSLFHVATDPNVTYQEFVHEYKDRAIQTAKAAVNIQAPVAFGVMSDSTTTLVISGLPSVMRGIEDILARLVSVQTTSPENFIEEVERMLEK